MVKDPVCGRETEDKGRTYYFCSTACKIRFDKNPGEYEVKVIIKKRRR